MTIPELEDWVDYLKQEALKRNYDLTKIPVILQSKHGIHQLTDLTILMNDKGRL